jgi:hypothetical protein
MTAKLQEVDIVAKLIKELKNVEDLPTWLPHTRSCLERVKNLAEDHLLVETIVKPKITNPEIARRFNGR